MFQINTEGRITREIFRPASHEARIMEAVPVPPDIVTLAEEARVAALLLPDIVASGLAPTTSYSYGLQFWYFERWCQASRRVEMPAMAETVALYLASLAIRKRTLPPCLAAQASIRFYHLTFHPELTPPIEDPRVVAVIMV